MNSTDARVAIVTGAARGIGAAVAQRLSSDGFAVAVLDLDESACAETVDAIDVAGGRALAVGVDVADADAVETCRRRGSPTSSARPTVLVNNAGITRDNLLFKMTEDDWDRVLSVHLRGAFLMSKAAQAHMTKAGWGRIVNLSSTSALGNRGQANYAAAKAGMQGFTKTLAVELGKFGVTANAIAPGFIVTDMTAVTAERHRRQLRGLPGGARRRDPGPARRHTRRHRARRVVLRQRGRVVRLRSGAVRRRRTSWLTLGHANLHRLAPSSRPPSASTSATATGCSIDQERIDAFADATGDHQWIHVDAERAASGPFGRDHRARLPDAVAWCPSWSHACSTTPAGR